MIRDGSGTPLVLFHSLLGSERVWRGVIPLLAPHHDTIALTMLGHRGGRPPHTRPATIMHFVEDALRTLDRLKIERAHLAGNSIGGALALELARRGRALSVCAFSPAYFHHADGGGIEQAVKAITAVIRDTNRGRPLMPLLARFGAFRRWALRDCAVHGDRLSVAETLDLADDTLGCVVGEDILVATPVPEPLAPMSPLPCAITLVWSAQDRIFPLAINGELARKTLPEARFVIIEDAGHVPMIDAPERVARTILEVAASTR